MLNKNDFKQDLTFSIKASDESFWTAIYHKAFPNMVSHMVCDGDTQSQRMGIDRVILLSNGRILKVDEKKRRKEYNDILLEYISVDKTGAPGWMEKDLSIDYLAYAFMQSKTVYLFDWCLLKRVWNHKKDYWIKNNSIPPAVNNGYNTLNVAVPIKELMSLVSTASIIKLQ